MKRVATIEVPLATANAQARIRAQSVPRGTRRKRVSKRTTRKVKK